MHHRPVRRNLTVAAVLPLLLLTALPVAAQRSTLFGTVRSEGSREPIPHAAVQIPELGRGVLANDRGYFVLTGVPDGSYTIRASSLGFQTAQRTVRVETGLEQAIELFLTPVPVAIAGIRVHGAREEGIVTGAAGPGPIRVDPTLADAVPALAEADVLRTLQTLPSVQAISDFSSALYVRGGSPDQNLMLLDGAPLFNPFHLGGVFGSIDPDAVSTANILPGAFPARVGDRISSAIEMRTREGGRDQVRGNGSVGLVSSRIGLDGPLPGERGSYLFSARRTYLDLFTDAAYRLGLIEGTLPYSFVDANLKVTHDVGALGRFSAAVHFDGEKVDIPDELDFSGDADFDFGTRSGSINYWQPMGSVIAEARAAISSFDGHFDAFELSYPITDGPPPEPVLEQILRARTTIRNALLAGDLTWYRGRHLVRAGIQVDQYRFAYDINSLDSDLSTFVPNFTLEQAPRTLAAYLEDQWSPLERLELRVGLRVLEGGDRGTAWMPRLGLEYELSPRISLSLGGGSYAQVLHSLRDEESLAASLVAYDLLAAVPVEIGLMRAQDLVTGASWSMPGSSIRVDAYTKRFTNLPIAPTPDELLEAPVIVTEGFVHGEGSARGIEFLGRHRRGAAELSLGYAYLEASRTVSGRSYPPRFERRHMVDAMAVLPLGRRGRASSRFVFGSGQPYTPAIGLSTPLVFDPGRGVFVSPDYGGATVVLGEHNAGRLPHYLRVDVAARREFDRRWFGRAVTFTPYLQVLNALNTRNVLFGEPTASGFQEPQLEYAPQLPIFPTLGMEWRF